VSVGSRVFLPLGLRGAIVTRVIQHQGTTYYQTDRLTKGNKTLTVRALDCTLTTPDPRVVPYRGDMVILNERLLLVSSVEWGRDETATPWVTAQNPLDSHDTWSSTLELWQSEMRVAELVP